MVVLAFHTLWSLPQGFDYLSVNIFPIRESFSKLFRAYDQSLLDQGGTYDIGQSLPQLICKHDMEIVSIEPIYRIARPGIKIWARLLDRGADGCVDLDEISPFHPRIGPPHRTIAAGHITRCAASGADLRPRTYV